MKLLQSALAAVCLASVGCSASRNGAQLQAPLDISHTEVATGSGLEHAAPNEEDETTRLLSLHRQLVEIESVSGNEYEVGMFLASYLSSHGFTVEKHEVKGSSNTSDKPRYNIYAHNNDDSSSSSTPRTSDAVLVSSHIDTVPPFYNYTMKGSASSDSTEIWGRGSVDAKGSVAAQITAAISLLKSDEVSRGAIALLYVVDEEVGGAGMRAADAWAAAEGIKWKAGVFGEPTELKLVAGHKGILAGGMTVRGKAAHSGYPWLGIDANAALVRALGALQALDLGSSDKYGNTTTNIGFIRAGVASNVVSAFAEAKFLLRLAVGTPDEVKKQIIEAVDDEQVEFEWTPGYPPVDCDVDVLGFQNLTVNYGTDVPHMSRKRVPKRYLYGPGNIFVAHGDHEHLTVRDLKEAVSGYKKLIKHAANA